MMKPSRPWFTAPWLHLALILIVAGLFRLWQIDSIPPGLFGDEATDGLDALDVLAGLGAVFFPANFGREGLHMWIVAGMFRVLGVTPLALRLPSAAAGIATALAAYWLGRELLAAWRRDAGRDAAAAGPWEYLPLVAALYGATSYWHVHFSRFGIRGVFTPLLGALAFAAFWRAVNRRSLVWFAASGAFLGLATHFYTASRFFPFFLAGFLAVQWLVAHVTGRRDRVILRQHLGGIVLLFAVAALVFAPLGVYFLQHPGSFAQRAGEVAAFGGEGAWVRMGRAAAANVLQFFLPGRGDAEQFYNLPGRAVFDPLTAALALTGLALTVWRWRRSPALFLALWFPALLLPSFLATDRWPTLPRVLGVIPGVYFFPAIGALGVAAALLRWRWRGARVLAAGLIVLALGSHAALTYRDYFVTWGPSATTYDALEGDMTAAWRWLDEHPTEGHVYLSSDIYRHPTFMLLHERATVQTYWEHTNESLSWFDARSALPLPAAGEKSTYLIAASSPLTTEAQAWLAQWGREVDVVRAPDGRPSLTVTEVAAGATAVATGQPEENLPAPVPVDDGLQLTGATVAEVDGRSILYLSWRTDGPNREGWQAYDLEIEAVGGDGSPRITVPFEGMRPTEWVAGGRFITWHELEGASPGQPGQLRLRLIDRADSAPAPWHTIVLP